MTLTWLEGSSVYQIENAELFCLTKYSLRSQLRSIWVCLVYPSGRVRG
jgi:hypothetical protein